MTWVNRGWLLIVLLCVAPVMAQTYSADNLVFERNNFHITSISTQFPRLATARFTVSGGAFDKLEFDAKPLFDGNGVKTLVMGHDSHGKCFLTSNNISNCEVNNLLLKPSSGTGTIPVTIFKGNLTVDQSLSFSFTIDNTQPNVKDITTTCHQGVCYIGSGANDLYIELEDTIATFNQGLVFYSVGSLGPFMVNSCNGMICQGRAAINCQDETKIDIRTTSFNGVPSQDDAGNPVKENLDKLFVCDRINPEFVSMVLQSSSGLEISIPGETLTITSNIKDKGIVTASANLKEFTGVNNLTTVNCAKSGEEHTCTFSFDVTQQGYKKFRVDFEYKDGGGNILNKEEEFEILRVQNTSGTNDFWNVGNVDCSPNTINARTLQLFNRRTFCSVSLTTSFSDVSILDQNIQSCGITGYSVNLGSEIINEGETIALKLNIPTSASSVDTNGSIFLGCNISIQNRRGNSLIRTPEIENFEFGMQIESVEDMPSRIQAELVNLEQDREDYEKVWGRIKKWSDIFVNSCRAAQSLSALAGVFGELEAASCLFGGPFSAAMGAANKKISDAAGVSSEGTWSVLGKFCSFMTCDWSWPNTVRDTITNVPGLDTTLGSYATAGLNPDELFRPENSLTWSFATACIPGVLSNMEKRQVIDCEYERCLREDTLQTGIPASACREVWDQNQCLYSRGQILDAIPYLHVFQNAGNIIMGVISNPIGVAGFVSHIVCTSLPPCTVHPACAIPAATKNVGSIKEIIDGMIRAYNSLTQLSSSSGDLCSRIDDLDELELYNPLIDPYRDEPACVEAVCSNSMFNVDTEGNAQIKIYETVEGARMADGSVIGPTQVVFYEGNWRPYTHDATNKRHEINMDSDLIIPPTFTSGTTRTTNIQQQQESPSINLDQAVLAGLGYQQGGFGIWEVRTKDRSGQPLATTSITQADGSEINEIDDLKEQAQENYQSLQNIEGIGEQNQIILNSIETQRIIEGFMEVYKTNPRALHDRINSPDQRVLAENERMGLTSNLIQTLDPVNRRISDLHRSISALNRLTSDPNALLASAPQLANLRNYYGLNPEQVNQVISEIDGSDQIKGIQQKISDLRSLRSSVERQEDGSTQALIDSGLLGNEKIESVEQAIEVIDSAIEASNQELANTDAVTTINEFLTGIVESHTQEMETSMKEVVDAIQENSQAEKELEEAQLEIQRLMYPGRFSHQEIGAAMRAGLGFVSATSWFLNPSSSFLTTWREAVVGAVGDIFNIQGTLATEWCDVDRDIRSTGVATGGPETNYRPAIHIEGYKKNQTNNSYEYIVTVVLTPPATGTVIFDIALTGTTSRALIVEDVQLNPGDSPYSKTQGNAIKVTSTNKHEIVCIEFDQIPNNAYGEFDSARHCNLIKEVE